MKLSESTINVLKNFSTINTGLVFKQGNVLRTMSKGQTVLAKATIPDSFDHEFTIYDLNRFLSLISTLELPELDFKEGEKNIKIISGKSKTTYGLSEESMVVAPPFKDIKVENPEVSFILTKDEAVFEKYKNHFDLLINSVSAPLDLNKYANMLKLNGSLVMVGLSGEPYPIDAFTMLNQRRRIAGSMIGGMKQTQEMLDFAGKHNIVSDVEIIKAEDINKAYERVVASDVKYRFVIDAKTI
jgi:hypothetical protein